MVPDRLAGISHCQAPNNNLAIRHHLAHPTRAARRQTPSRSSVSQFRLAEPTLLPGTLCTQ